MRERIEIDRLQSMLALFESETCLTRRLAEHFGDSSFGNSTFGNRTFDVTPDTEPGRCGHCSVCYGHSVRLPEAPPEPPLTATDFQRYATPLMERHIEQLDQPPNAQRLAHFLCGLTMPVFTPLKARSLHGFAVFEQRAYPEVRQWAEAMLGG